MVNTGSAYVERGKPTCVLAGRKIRRQLWPPQERPSSHYYIVTGNKQTFGLFSVSRHAGDVQRATDICFHGCVALVSVTVDYILSKAAAQPTSEGAGGLKGCFCSVDDPMEILLG